MSLSDISADGDIKLVIADLGTGSYDIKLKVYRGITLTCSYINVTIIIISYRRLNGDYHLQEPTCCLRMY
jgi:hypothetical protein